MSGYAGAIDAPVRTQTRVTKVTRTDDGYHVATDGATGSAERWCSRAARATCPPFRRRAPAVPPSIPCFTPLDYGNPDRLPEGGVLVVGASATGVQLADEIHRSGRPVVLAVGEHVRMPRLYRGHDVFWWMDAAGVSDQRYDEVDDIVRARGVPSPQLVGTPERATLDLNALTAAGVEAHRTALDHPRRQGAVLGRPAEPVRARRSQDEPPARHLRRVGARERQRRRRASAGAVRADPRAGLAAARARSRQRRDPLHPVGHRLSSRLRLARRAGARSQGLPTARRRRGGLAGPLRPGASVPAPAQVELHSRRRGRRARSRRAPRTRGYPRRAERLRPSRRRCRRTR